MRSQVAVLAITAIFSWTPVGTARAEWRAGGTVIQVGESFPRIVPDAAGGIYVTSENWFSHLQRLNVTGSLEWPGDGLSVSDRGGQGLYDVPIPDGAGGVYVVWYRGPVSCGGCYGEAMKLSAQHFTSAGSPAPGWTATDVPLAVYGGEVTGPAYEPAAISDGRGGLIAAWNTLGVHAQSMSAAGERRWGESASDFVDVSSGPSYPALASDESGGAYLFWGDHRNGSQSRIFGQHIDADGTPTWISGGIPVARGSFVPEAFIEGPPVAISDQAHGAIVAWAGIAGSEPGVHAARVTRGGGLPWRSDVEITSVQAQWLQLISDGDGGSILAWYQPGTGEVFIQRLGRNGREAWISGGIRVAKLEGTGGPVALASDGSGGAFLAWGDLRPDAVLFATHFTHDGEIAAGWPAGGAEIAARPNESTGIESLALTATGDAASTVVWQDEEILPDRPYLQVYVIRGMRLEPRGPAAEPMENPSPEPAGMTSRDELSIRALGGASLDLALPSESVGTLELFDVVGRRVTSRSVVGAGHHIMSAVDRGQIPAGIYLARLTQSGRSAIARIAIVH